MSLAAAYADIEPQRRPATLEQLERVIEGGLQTFVEVGLALLEIRDRRLYRAAHATFEDYCRERWQFTPQHAGRMIAAANVARILEPMGSIPSTERQARELVPLMKAAPMLVADAWQEARNEAAEMDRDVTASDVRVAVARRLSPEEIRREATGAAEGVQRNPQLYSSESVEWYTPTGIVTRVERVLGQIDLDPCSNPGDPHIPARIHYTAEDDGLARPWGGRVYMNPPYGRVIAEWVEKLCREYRERTVTEAIALVPARTDTEWFSRFRDQAICFVRGRLSFSAHENPAPFPSCAIYLGENVPGFVDAFGDLGDVWRRWQSEAA